MSLTQQQDNPAIWQAQCIAIWRQLVEETAKSNTENPTQQRMARDQYPKLFLYLAEGAPETTESVLTLLKWKWEDQIWKRR